MRVAATRPRVAAWMPIAAGLAALYVPTYWGLATHTWNEPEQAHGPIMLSINLWLWWQARGALKAAFAAPALGVTAVATGGTVFAFGLLLYVFGRSQQVVELEVASQLPVFFGLLLSLGGRGAVRAVWFPLLFLVFLVPLPGFLVVALTGPLKQGISLAAEHLLYWAGYPVARNGVMLVAGPYQLLVADACSGLHSMYALVALGLFYVYLAGEKSVFRNALLLAAVVPVALAANLFRVILLILITYHFGDAAGQGFLHGFAGIFLFAAALGLFFAMDSLLGRLAGLSRPKSHRAEA